MSAGLDLFGIVLGRRGSITSHVSSGPEWWEKKNSFLDERSKSPMIPSLRNNSESGGGVSNASLTRKTPSPAPRRRSASQLPPSSASSTPAKNERTVSRYVG
jgi:hypothetical protein